MNAATRSDALVFFGATGDLAHKMIFPALQAMVKRGHLNVPIIGVAKARWKKTPGETMVGREVELLAAAVRLQAVPCAGPELTEASEESSSKAGPSTPARRDLRRDEMDAYERLLGDAMNGDGTLFAREDAVEAEWRIVAPILSSTTPPHEYQPGTWGPVEADRLMNRSGPWHKPQPAPPRRPS